MDRTERSSLALGAIGFGAVVIGTFELVMIGVPEPVAEALGIWASAAGSVVTASSLDISFEGRLLNSEAAPVRSWALG